MDSLHLISTSQLYILLRILMPSLVKSTRRKMMIALSIYTRLHHHSFFQVRIPGMHDILNIIGKSFTLDHSRLVQAGILLQGEFYNNIYIEGLDSDKLSFVFRVMGLSDVPYEYLYNSQTYFALKISPEYPKTDEYSLKTFDRPSYHYFKEIYNHQISILKQIRMGKYIYDSITNLGIRDIVIGFYPVIKTPLILSIINHMGKNINSKRIVCYTEEYKNIEESCKDSSIIPVLVNSSVCLNVLYKIVVNEYIDNVNMDTEIWWYGVVRPVLNKYTDKIVSGYELLKSLDFRYISDITNRFKEIKSFKNRWDSEWLSISPKGLVNKKGVLMNMGYKKTMSHAIILSLVAYKCHKKYGIKVVWAFIKIFERLCKRNLLHCHPFIYYGILTALTNPKAVHLVNRMMMNIIIEYAKSVPAPIGIFRRLVYM